MSCSEQSPGLVKRYREELQVRHYARRTVSSDEHWLRRFLRFHRMRQPREMGEAEINAFLSHLATEEKVSASTQNQALAAADQGCGPRAALHHGALRQRRQGPAYRVALAPGGALATAPAGRRESAPSRSGSGLGRGGTPPCPRKERLLE